MRRDDPAYTVPDSRERVALDLAMAIADAESKTAAADQKVREPRKYYLTLYEKCLSVTNGKSADYVLRDS